MVEPGYRVFDYDSRVAAWAEAARAATESIDISPDRCGQTWHVGVDDLPNTPDGSVSGVPLTGPWQVEVDHWHRAQISVVYPGYPQKDIDESDASHRFRVERCAAHMDGLLPEGPRKRRHLREPHAFILGLPMNDCASSPLVVWPGSHLIMQEAFALIFKGLRPEDWGDVDVTDVYQKARRTVFERIEPVPVQMSLGQSVLLHRHLIHGVAPWSGPQSGLRMIAYFRPQFADISSWL